MFLPCRDHCLKPRDQLFNWPVKKDKPGTFKPQLPRIIVTPPSTPIKPVTKKKKTRSNWTCLTAPPKKLLDLGPKFWSQPQTQTERARRPKINFKCRHFECKEQFPSVRDREMHEDHCLSFVKVFLIFNQYANVTNIKF